MKTHIYNIYDKVAQEFGPIFQATNDGVASRNFKQITNKSPYPGDFVLYHLAEVTYTEVDPDALSKSRYVLVNEDVRVVDLNIIEEVTG